MTTTSENFLLMFEILIGKPLNHSTAGAFFTFYVIVYFGYFALSCFFRLLGAISFNFDMVIRLSSVIVISLALYSGYIIPVSQLIFLDSMNLHMSIQLSWRCL